jgi:hypothetical protein
VLLRDGGLPFQRLRVNPQVGNPDLPGTDGIERNSGNGSA